MREAIWPAVLLAWIAGFVDALGYRALDRVFTAHMSGNAAAAGAQLGAADWSDAALRGLAIPAFLLGVAVAALSIRLRTRHQRRVRLAPAFTFELALLVAFIALCPQPHVPPGTLHFYTLVWLLAAAMGVQSATLHRAGGRRVQTTFVSGMLARFGEESVAWLLRRVQPLRTDAAPHHGRYALMAAGIFLSFMIGAVLGSRGEIRYGASALVVPSVALLVVIAEDVLRSRGSASG